MKKIENVDLYSFNTMRLHSIADTVFYPTTITELQELGNLLKQDCLLLAAGSNVILPKRIHRPVISLMSLNNKIELIEDGYVRVGCSVRVQKLIRFLQKNSFGGIEYLFSVPASMGGLVYMNAGRGRKFNLSIADYLQSVDYLDLEDLKIKRYYVKREDFTYRHSPFQNMKIIIFELCFKFKRQNPNETESLIKSRLEYSKQYLSADNPSCGSIFCKGNKFIFRLLRGMRKGGAIFSKKTSNWISNIDNATYEDVCWLIYRAQFIHKLFFSSCQTEVKIIKD